MPLTAQTRSCLALAMIVSRANMLSQHRNARGWSQQALADKSGVSRTEISAVEMGRLVPSVAVALRLAAALGESVETVFGGRQEAPAATWAWEPSTPDARCWWASMKDKLLAYPVELTAAGSIPHDRVVPAGEKTTGPRPDKTLVVAGCDPLVGLLAHEMAARYGIRVPLLRAVKRSNCCAAVWCTWRVFI
jgi:transcriptional regulator with XRE-family HTH domain